MQNSEKRRELVATSMGVEARVMGELSELLRLVEPGDCCVQSYA